MTTATATKPAGPHALPRNMIFDVEDWNILARCWHPVALERELGDQPLGVTLLMLLLWSIARTVTSSSPMTCVPIVVFR